MSLSSSPQLSHWPQALTPHFMDHGPPEFFCVCVCVSVCVCVNDEKQKERCNSIFGHLECLASAPFSLKGCEWQTGEHTWSPAAPRAHRRTHKHTHCQAGSNASLKAPELRGKPLWCLFYRAVKC